MKNNPFVIFVTAFIVVMGSGLAFAAIGGQSESSRGLEESSFAVDFGGEIESQHPETAIIETTEARETGLPDGSADEKKAEKQEARADEPTDGEGRSDQPLEKEEATDDATWIEVLFPTDRQVFEDKSVVFEGRAEQGAKVYAGEYQADINDDGGWRIVLFLAPGTQTVEFKAIDPAGNRATDSVTVSLETGQEKPKAHEFTVHQKYLESREPFEKFYGTGTPGMGVVARSEFGVADARVRENGEWWLPIEFSGLLESKTFPITISTTEGFSGTYWFSYLAKTHEFTANQQYGSCTENPPYDVFWGTGVPGTAVEVGSAYGSGRAEVGEGGNWEMKVFFETAPVGQPFEVVVADSLGNAKGFSFTRLDGQPK